jgi:hypothetical protein
MELQRVALGSTEALRLRPAPRIGGSGRATLPSASTARSETGDRGPVGERLSASRFTHREPRAQRRREPVVAPAAMWKRSPRPPAALARSGSIPDHARCRAKTPFVCAGSVRPPPRSGSTWCPGQCSGSISAHQRSSSREHSRDERTAPRARGLRHHLTGQGRGPPLVFWRTTNAETSPRRFSVVRIPSRWRARATFALFYLKELARTPPDRARGRVQPLLRVLDPRRSDRGAQAVARASVSTSRRRFSNTGVSDERRQVDLAIPAHESRPQSAAKGSRPGASCWIFLSCQQLDLGRIALSPGRACLLTVERPRKTVAGAIVRECRADRHVRCCGSAGSARARCDEP